MNMHDYECRSDDTISTTFTYSESKPFLNSMWKISAEYKKVVIEISMHAANLEGSNFRNDS